ncbi:MAG TPA: bifunctional riboflavin kinase/FAD synthetase [Phnomibacter sp.]|nr:bifunctional riboflavin kinase/FAD synthetase [Phnomibacter sp.]
MQVHTDIEKLPDFKNAVVTIGTFDGVHAGHRIILNQLVNEAKASGGESVLVTFNPHPRYIIARQQGTLKLINTIPEKIQLLQEIGIDHLVIVPFTKQFADLTAEDYVQHFLVKHFHPCCLIIGYDHRFGKNRHGNFALLETLQGTYKYRLIEIPVKLLNEITISSTQIRQAIAAGEIEKAKGLLSYDYFFEGLVTEGNKLGRTIGYPTANLKINDAEKLVPGNGVYAVYVSRVNRPAQPPMLGMMNIGIRPTVNGTHQTIEVNIFDFDEEIYGEFLRIQVVARLRSEQKFSGLDALKAQLLEDKKAAQLVLKAV